MGVKVTEVVSRVPESGGRGRLQASMLPPHAGRRGAGYRGTVPRVPAGPPQLVLVAFQPNPSLCGDTAQLQGQDVGVGFWDL